LSYDPDGSIASYCWTLPDGTHEYGTTVTLPANPGDSTIVTLEVNDYNGITESSMIGYICYYELGCQIIGPQCGCVDMDVRKTGKIKGKNKYFPSSHTIDDGDFFTTDDDQKLGSHSKSAPANPKNSDTAMGSFNFEVYAKIQYTMGTNPGDCTHYQKFQLDEKCNGQQINTNDWYGQPDWDDHPVGGGTWANDDYDNENENSYRINHENGNKPEIDWIDGPMRTNRVRNLKNCAPGGLTYECLFCAVVDGPLGCCRCKFKVKWKMGSNGQIVETPTLDKTSAGLGCTTGAQGTCGC
jgi:hypothetical protein